MRKMQEGHTSDIGKQCFSCLLPSAPASFFD